MSRTSEIAELVRLILAYRLPAEDLAGVRTFVRKDDDVSEGVGDKDRAKSPALPLKKRRNRRLPLSDGGSSDVRNVGYNKPDGDADLPQVKTLSEPGEERGVPYKSTVLPTRRTMEAFYREERSPEDWGSEDLEGKLPQGQSTPPDTKGSPSKMLRPEEQNPSWPLEVSETYDAAGSSRVIPYNSDISNKKATTLRDIERFVSPAVQDRSKRYNPRLSSFSDGVWSYRVGKWEVKVESVSPQSSRSQNLSLSDLKITCSCPFWRWQGPEHWGVEDDYLHENPRGTASFPGIRDPNHEHAVCKHAYAVFSKMRNFKRRSGTTKQATSRQGSRTLRIAVAYRYLSEE